MRVRCARRPTYQGQALNRARRPAGAAQSSSSAAREENGPPRLVCPPGRGARQPYKPAEPLWYGCSLAIGAIAGLVGDRWSLGFLAETEHQVVAHLEGHLARLPPSDERSRVILEQMKGGQGRHATVAIEAGAATCPRPSAMRWRPWRMWMTGAAYIRLRLIANHC